jgi:RNA polymerase sigma factor (sigma-70 family)
MNQTQELLRTYVASGSEEAFRELVLSYVDLVYSTALRLVNGDANLAEDICQTVFIDLARKARTLSPDVKLGGWLHRDTCFVASKIRRAEASRKRRELEAIEMNEPNDHPNLENVAPVLDQAINQLNDDDRTAILLRFFEQLDFRSIGETLGSSEAAAQKRVSRALAKLQILLEHRGVTFSAVALGTALTAEAVTKTPVAFTATLPASVLTSVAHSGHTLIFTKIMAATKSKAALVSFLVLASAVTSLVVKRQAAASLSAQKGSLDRWTGQVAQLTAENLRLSKITAAANHLDQKNQFDELRRLRAEADRLRTEAEDLPTLREKQRVAARRAQDAQTVFQIKETIAARRDYVQGWTTAFVAYAHQNGGQLPKTFEQAEPFWPPNIPKQANATPSDDFDILYNGSLNTLTNLDIVILRERKLWPYGNEFFGTGKFGRQYGMAGGYLNYCSSSDKTENGSFEAYEKDHILPTTQ